LDLVIAWIVSIIVSVAPVGRPQYVAEAKETDQETQARYESIAKDLIDVVYDPSEKPLYSGPMGRAKTVEVILAIASFESGFRKDVDFGKGKFAKGDGGRSWCFMQVNLGQAGANGKTTQRLIVNADGTFTFTTDPTKGFGGEDLVANRKSCFKAGLSIIRTSFNMCGPTDAKDKLMVYASGACGKGQKESRLRMGLALRWMEQKPSPLDDAAVANLKKGPPPPTPKEEVATTTEGSFVLPPIMLDQKPSGALLFQGFKGVNLTQPLLKKEASSLLWYADF